ncbi:MAG: hypothetical protein ACOCUL_02965 [Bacteroidota bacterium]
MEYKTITEINYEYECTECGNTFSSKEKKVAPFCYDCGGHNIAEDITKNKIKMQYCPICGKYFKTSNHLQEVIKNKHVRWLANMVTHYRHEHITSWNKCWGRNGHYYQHGWFTDYEQEKAKVNERAKRQILRKCKDYMIKNKFKVEHVQQLQNTEPKTLELYAKIL